MKTYAQAKLDMLAYLKSKGWAVSGALKIPHATSPDGDLRLWFKPQAVYFTESGPRDLNRHQFGNARTAYWPGESQYDTRAMTGEEAVARILGGFGRTA